MTRLPLAGLFAAAVFGPWSGCDRDPVDPPAPSAERAPAHGSAPVDGPDRDGIVLHVATRTRG